jgi:LysM repeat protein
MALAAAGLMLLAALVFGVTRLVGGSATNNAAPVASTPAVATPLTATEPTAIPSQGPIQTSISPVEPTYTVQSGDTLATIARRFNTTVEALQSINNLPDRNALRVGQRLVIP